MRKEMIIMKKYGKILAVVMVMAMLMASVMGVSAAPSSTTDVTVSGDSASKYEVADKEDAFKDLAGTDQKAYDNLTKFNEGTIKTEDLIADASDEIPSWIQPSPAKHHTLESKILASAVLNVAPAIFAEIAIPTALPIP